MYHGPRDVFTEIMVAGTIVLALLAYATVPIFYTPDFVAESVRSAGLDNVRITGWAPLQCGDDMFCRHFTAERDGKPIRSVVGCGLLKSCTIRW